MKTFYNKNEQVLIIIAISLLYAFIFSGYNLCNQYLLVLYPEFGVYLSSLLFGSMFLCTIVAPYISHYLLTVKWTVIIGTFGTTIWLISFNIDIPYLVIIATILSGFGSGLYRSHQFMLIKKLYPENISRNMGISLSVFNLHGIITTPIIFTMLFFNVSIYTVLKGFTIVVIVSQLLLVTIRNVKSESKKLNYINMLKTKLWLLLPLSMAQAINFTTYFVFIPKNINEQFASPIILIALLSVIYSIICPIATYIVGILFNKTISYRWMYFVLSIILSIIMSIYILYIFDYHTPNQLYDYITISILATLYALYDPIIYTINMIIMAQLFNENAFCVQRIFYCFHVMLFVALVKVLPSYLFLGLLILLNVLSLLGYLLLDNTECENCDNDSDNDMGKYEEIV